MKRLLSLIPALLLAQAVFAQGLVEHKPRVQHSTPDWKKVSSDHFDIYYSGSELVLAQQAARQAEAARYEFSKTFDHESPERYAFFLFTSPYDLIQHTQFSETQYKKGGITEIPDHTGWILHNGSATDFYASIKYALAKQVFEEFFFGGGIQNSIQNHVLLHMPEWYNEGLAGYFAEGWTAQDEMQMRAIIHQNLLKYTEKVENVYDRTAAKSVWYFIERHYGRDKLAEIFYMTRLTRSVESGIITVLGISLKTLTERWREFMLSQISENESNRIAVEDVAEEIELENGERLIGWDANPAKPEIAVMTMDKGIHKLRIFDTQTGTFRETALEGGYKTDQLDRLFYHVPVAWSHNGNFILTTAFHEGSEKMALYDVQANSVTYISYQPVIAKINDFAWSHDDRLIAVSAMKGGQTDLFVTKPGSNHFQPVTNDKFDDYHPVWTLDDQKLIYSSTRTTDSLSVTSDGFFNFRKNLDLWMVEFPEEQDSITRLTHTPDINERPLEIASSFEVIYMTDDIGIPNLMKRNIFIPDSTWLTNVQGGLWNYSTGAGGMQVVAVSDLEAERLYYLPQLTQINLPAYIPTRLRYEYQKQQEEIRRQELIKQDRLLKKKTGQEETFAEEPETEPEKGQDEHPTVVKEKKKDKEVRFYVFDEEDNTEKKTVTPSKKNKKKIQAPVEEPGEPDFSEIQLKASGDNSQWSTEYVASLFGYDPVFKLNFLMSAGLKDLKGHHSIYAGFRPYLDLKSSDFFAEYNYLKMATDIFGRAERKSRYFNDEFLIRYNSLNFSTGARYPLNDFMKLEGRLGGTYINRIDMNFFQPGLLDGQAIAGEAEGGFTYENIDQVEGFIRRGFKLKTGVLGVYDFKGSGFNFATISLDANHFQPMFGPLVLSTRLQAGVSMGPHQQKFYMGGVQDQFFSNFENVSDLPVDDVVPAFNYIGYITPARGFAFNSRNGTKYVLANLDMHIPLSKMLSNNLNSNPRYNVELIPFFDIGTIWTSGNPLDQKNPIFTETISSYPLNITVQTLRSPFVVGFGSGIKTFLFGYHVRFDLGWGVEDYSVQNPKLHLSLTRNF